MNIEFVCSDKVVLKNFPILPAKDCLPEWYAKLKADSPNISKCWPVRDIITAGYILQYCIRRIHLLIDSYETQLSSFVFPSYIV